MVVDNEETRLCDDNEGEILTLIGWWWPGGGRGRKGTQITFSIGVHLMAGQRIRTVLLIISGIMPH